MDGDTGDVVCDDYHKLEELNHLLALGAPLYRYCTSWSRLFPFGEAFGLPLATGARVFNRLFDGFVQSGITPVVAF